MNLHQRMLTELWSAASKIVLSLYLEQISLAKKTEVHEEELDLQALEENWKTSPGGCMV